MLSWQCVVMYGEHTVFNVGRTFLSDHFAGRNARVTLLMPKRLTLGVAVANLAGNQTIKMAFPQFAELWKLIDLLVRKDFRQANLDTLGGSPSARDYLTKITSH